MKNSLRIHKWTHNEFNIFILGVLTHPPCVAGSAQIHVHLLAEVDALAVVPMVVMHLVEVHVMECVQQVVRVLWLCFK